MLADVIEHVGLCSRGETTNGGKRAVIREFFDEPRNVLVVRAEVVAPLRQTVGLIENPGTDLSLGDGASESLVAELFWGDEQYPDVTKLDFPGRRRARALSGGRLALLRIDVSSQ